MSDKPFDDARKAPNQRKESEGKSILDCKYWCVKHGWQTKEKCGICLKVSDVFSKVNHPPHYTYGEIECMTYIEDQGLDKDHCLATALAYIVRAPHKGEFKRDIEKAVWYLNRRLTLIPDVLKEINGPLTLPDFTLKGAGCPPPGTTYGADGKIKIESVPCKKEECEDCTRCETCPICGDCIEHDPRCECYYLSGRFPDVN